jgi:hypothetical protein
MVRASAQEAVDWASVSRAGYGGYCLQFTRNAWDVASYYGSARDAWNGAKYKHPTSSTSGVAYGAPLFMDKSTSTYGHVAVYVGSGKMATTDSQKTYTYITPVQNWLNAGYHLLGWTEDLNGVKLPIGSGGGGGGGSLATDGMWGPATTKALQKLAGHSQDGKVSGQNEEYKGPNPGLQSSTFQWVTPSQAGGSQIIAWIQGQVGVGTDGRIGPNTIKAMQRHYGTTQDGIVSAPSSMVTAMQKALNAGKF